MSCWILRCGPKEFRLKNWLQDFNWVADESLVDCWYIDDFVEEVKPGDTIFIWTYDGNEKAAGIYGEGRVVTIPEVFPLAEREMRYFTNPESMKSITALG